MWFPYVSEIIDFKWLTFLVCPPQISIRRLRNRREKLKSASVFKEIFKRNKNPLTSQNTNRQLSQHSGGICWWCFGVFNLSQLGLIFVFNLWRSARISRRHFTRCRWGNSAHRPGGGAGYGYH